MSRPGLAPAAVVLGTIVLGALGGLVFALAQSPPRRAEAAVLVTSPAGPHAVRPMLGNLRELATSSVVAGNVRSTLRLSDPPAAVRDRLEASVRPASQVIVIKAEDHDSETARRIAQEAALVFSQLVQARFGSATPAFHAALFDSAQVKPSAGRHLVRDTGIGAAIGLAIGLGVWLVGRRPRETPSLEGLDGEGKRLRRQSKDLATREEKVARRLADLDERSRLHDERVLELAKRERALARRAGELAAREQAVATTTPGPASDAVLVAADDDAGPSAGVEAPEPGRRETSVTIAQLERLVAQRTDASPQELEELRDYLFFLRPYATADGRLPPGFDRLIGDVFGPVVGRAAD